MANRCFFIKKQSKSFEQEGDNVELANNYTIPLYWLALFKKNDLIYRDINMMDGSVEKWPTLITEVSTAIKEFEFKKEKLLSLVTDKYYYLYDLFLEMLRNTSEKYIQLDIDEIRCMDNDTKIFDDDLISTLDEINNDFKLHNQKFINEVVGFEIDKNTGRIIENNEDKIICGLCGYGWKDLEPWEN